MPDSCLSKVSGDERLPRIRGQRLRRRAARGKSLPRLGPGEQCHADAKERQQRARIVVYREQLLGAVCVGFLPREGSSEFGPHEATAAAYFTLPQHRHEEHVGTYTRSPFRWRCDVFPEGRGQHRAYEVGAAQFRADRLHQTRVDVDHRAAVLFVDHRVDRQSAMPVEVRSEALQVGCQGIVKLFGNGCGAVDVSGLGGER